MPLVLITDIQVDWEPLALITEIQTDKMPLELITDTQMDKVSLVGPQEGQNLTSRNQKIQ